MAPGEVFSVDIGDTTDLSYVDTGMYGIPEYGAVYVLDAAEVALVDTGIGTHYDRILEALSTLGIDHGEVSWVAVTHVHLDHAGGAGFLADACQNASIAVHSRGAPHLVDPDRLWAGTKAAVGEEIDAYTRPVPVADDRIVELADGDTIDLGAHELRVHHAPGHAPHQVVFDDPANDAVFTADAAGIYVPATETVEPTSPPPQFDLEQCLADVETIRGLDPGTLCYAHFGPVEPDDVLAEYEQTLESWVTAIQDVRMDRPDEAVIEYFVERADLADVWGERKAKTETAMNVRGVLQYLDSR